VVHSASTPVPSASLRTGHRSLPAARIARRSSAAGSRHFPALAGLALALAATLVLSSGCQSSRNPDGKPRVLRPGQPIHSGELELTDDDERRIEAHARFAAGIVEELSEAPEAALAHYRVAIEKDPTNEALTLDVVRKLVELRRFEDARVLLEKSTARPDSSGLLWGWLGTVYKLQGNPQAAIRAHQEAVRRMPRNLVSYQGLAQVYLEGGQISDALAVLEEAGRQPDVDATFLVALADTLGALQATRNPALGDLRPRIVPLLDRAAELKPTQPGEVLRLADLYQVFGEAAKALPLYQRLLETAPDLPGLRERLAGVYLRGDNREKAAEQLEALSRSQPTNPLPHYYLGVLALEAKRYEDAVTAFNRVLLLRPDNEAIYLDLALAHLSHRRPEDAIAVLDKARAKFRGSFRLEFYTAAALTDLKRYEQAIRHYTAAEVIAGATDPDELTYIFYFQSGVAYERAKRFDDAAVQFEKAVELKPDFGEALNYLGYMWAERGTNLERAHDLIKKAVEIEPDNEAFLDSLAWVLHQLGRSAEALPHQLRAVELAKDEPDATLFDHLGDIYRKLGKTDDARKAWQRAQELEAKPEVAQKLQDTAP
jgi:tetratricopeptide (TPR) repeat protein